jgi:secondary thiamine-phosphate synthase enzyme
MIKDIILATHSRNELVNIDRQIKKVVSDSGIQEGICIIWIPHTTAAVTINENADPTVVKDILYEMGKIIPQKDNYNHFEGNSDAHIKSSFFGSSLSLIVSGGNLVLGTWQSIYFCEFDGPRNRRILVKVMEG